ncbi:hypothetical protein Fcan01_01985 [Folsomia candida]|uniref:CABIT domain-containing protein n=1 Tax=Folsomia candida TaxID=158441 RepID=A0A226F3D4_FOLCA|nr:hypothetical protein Fcan01_01985 [Folsomia candida]
MRRDETIFIHHHHPAKFSSESVLFIPFSATGVFYPIAPRGGRNPQHIYPLSAIAKIHRLPLRIKMVYGALPPNIPDFTGTLQLERVDTEEVVLACTLMRDKPLLFEIDLDCDLFLSQMTSEDLFIQSTGYQTAFQFCRGEADNWRRQVRNYQFGSKAGKGGTVSGAYLLSVKEKNKSLRLRAKTPSSSSTPSKLSLLFRPSSAPFGSTKDLRRTKSFNVETQSVSISLDEDQEEETKKLSTLFNFMAGRKNKSKHPPLRQQMSRVGECMLNKREKSSEYFHCKEIHPPPMSLALQENVQKHVEGTRNAHSLHISQQNHTNNNNASNKLLLHGYNQSVPDVLSNNKNPLIISHSNQEHKNLLFSRSQRHVLSLHCNGGVGGGGTNSSSGCSSLGNLSYGNCSLSLSPIPPCGSGSSSGNSSSGGKGSPDVPYGTVADDVGEEENIYSEIADALTMKLSLNPIHQMGLNFHHHHRQQLSNMSSLMKGGGGSDGTFSGTLSGTFSSSNPSNRDDDIYDAVF